MNISFPPNLVARRQIAAVSVSPRARAISCALVVAALGVAPLQASWSLYQNFQSLPVGYDIADNSNPNENFSVGLQEGDPHSGGYTVAVDSTNSGNKLLEINAIRMAFTGAMVDSDNNSLSILDNTTGTVFYRIYREGIGTTPDVNFGIADQSSLLPNPPSANQAGLFESQLNVSGGTDIFRPRNGGGTVGTGVNWTASSWFGIFQVINNTTNTTQFYYQGESDLSPILMTGAGGTPFNMGFRNGAAGALTNWLVVNGLSASQDTFYLDDIYVDITGSNLVAPVSITSVPEPATAGIALAVLCGTAVVVHRRRRSR